jgi:hypothetical protein
VAALKSESVATFVGILTVTATKSKTRFWRQLRTRFDLCLIPDWETLYRSIIAPSPLPLGADTS